MSVSDRGPIEHATGTAADGVGTVQQFVSTLTTALEETIRAVAFWFATLLPLSYLPLLATGVTAEHPLGFAALLASNVAAFVLGHAHEPSED